MIVPKASTPAEDLGAPNTIPAPPPSGPFPRSPARAASGEYDRTEAATGGALASEPPGHDTDPAPPPSDLDD